MLVNGETAEYVGKLECKTVNDPSAFFSPSERFYVFVSFRGPDTREIIARPTYWFLKNKLKVEAFLDDESMGEGEIQDKSLLTAAYKCTHALVLVSPGFRESDDCVKELNTFMYRHTNKNNITIIPALWGITNLKGYVNAFQTIVWVSWDIRQVLANT
mmetsp:Transcript_27326/g.38652  ORF Transcript_27326/g.38652 Transcript_27326/m.38652 type:complete len:158 (-) Transcript_27326:661-1134(-)